MEGTRETKANSSRREEKKEGRRRECCSPAEFVTVERYIIPFKGDPKIEATGGSSFTCHICHETRAESARVIYSWTRIGQEPPLNIRRRTFASSILDIDESELTRS